MAWRTVALGCVAVCATALGACSSTTHPRVIEVVGDTTSTELLLGIDSCNQDPEVKAEESSTEVRLKVTAGPDNGDDCADGASVTLDAPVGDRRIIDDATGETLELIVPAS